MYFVFAYNQEDLATTASWSAFCQGSYDKHEEAERQATDLSHKDFCYILNGYNGELADMKPVEWNTRARTKTKPEAMALIAARLQKLKEEKKDGDYLDEVEEFATKWNVPFSAEMHTLFMAKFIHDDEPAGVPQGECFPSDDNWDNSSADC